MAVAAGCLLSACGGKGGTAGVTTDNVSGLATAGSTALKAATLNDADVKDLSDKSCASLDASAKIAAPKSKEALRLARIVKGMPAAVDGTPINYKVYLTKDVNAWAMNNGCVRVYSGLLGLMNDDEVRAVVGHEIATSGSAMQGRLQTAFAASAARQVALRRATRRLQRSASRSSATCRETGQCPVLQVQESLPTIILRSAENRQIQARRLARPSRSWPAGRREQLLSSHPSSSERAQRMREKIAAKK